MGHPMYGEIPGVPKDTFYISKRVGEVEVFVRFSGADNGGEKKESSLFILIKNQSADTDIVVKPTISFIDSNGQVLQVMDYQALVNSLRSAANQSASGGSFFAFGNTQFVSAAVGGYAIGSIINEISSSSRRARASKFATLIEKHWVKSEYKIPPSSYVSGLVMLNGLPELPIKIRVTIGEKTYIFNTVDSYAIAAQNYEESKKN